MIFLTRKEFSVIIIHVQKATIYAGVLEWQTSWPQTPVFNDMRVQVPSPAPKRRANQKVGSSFLVIEIRGLNPRGSAVYKNSVGHCFLGRAVKSGTVGIANGRQAISMHGIAVADGQVPSPAPKSTNLDRGLSILLFHSYLFTFHYFLVVDFGK